MTKIPLLHGAGTILEKATENMQNVWLSAVGLVVVLGTMIVIYLLLFIQAEKGDLSLRSLVETAKKFFEGMV